MSPLAASQPGLIDWGVASRPLAGEAVCGDLHVVKGFDHGVLLAAIDGLGHGPEATVAAQAAAAILEEHAQEPVVSLFQRCHQALVMTRGAVMTLASVHGADATLTWLGVGNVEGRLLRCRAGLSPDQQSALLLAGLVGYQLPALRANVVSLQAGELLILATDGIRPGFTEGLKLDQPPRQLADDILTRHVKETDDALVLVARFSGVRHE